MIIDSYDIETEPIISLKDFYSEQKHLVDICLIIFSAEIHKHLLEKLGYDLRKNKYYTRYHILFFNSAYFISNFV